MPAFPAEFGMPLRVDLLSAAPRKTERFYRGVLGWSYRNTAPVHENAREASAGRRVAMLSGMPVSVLLEADQDASDGADAFVNQWRVNFHVDSAEAAVEKARALGAEVFQEPTALVDGSSMAVVADPAGGLIGLLEQPGEQAFIAAGEPGTPVWFELVAGPEEGFDKVAEFYRDFFGWEIAVRNKTEQGTFAVAMEDGAPFAGLVASAVAAQTDAANQDFVGWLAYLGVENIDTAVAKAEELGGSVLVAPQATEFGPLATVQDPCGAAVVLCEVPLPPEEDIRESDPLEGIDLSEFM